MTPTEKRLARERDGAKRFGEINADQVIMLACKNTDLTRAMWRAIHQLRVGKIAEARKTLEKALADDHR